MSDSTYANQEVDEGTVSTTVTITFARRSRAIEIINDSAVDDLEYKFAASATFATLKPSEALSMDFHTRQILLNSPSANSVAYRIRAIG